MELFSTTATFRAVRWSSVEFGGFPSTEQFGGQFGGIPPNYTEPSTGAAEIHRTTRNLATEHSQWPQRCKEHRQAGSPRKSTELRNCSVENSTELHRTTRNLALVQRTSTELTSKRQGTQPTELHRTPRNSSVVSSVEFHRTTRNLSTAQRKSTELHGT